MHSGFRRRRRARAHSHQRHCILGGGWSTNLHLFTPVHYLCGARGRRAQHQPNPVGVFLGARGYDLAILCVSLTSLIMRSASEMPEILESISLSRKGRSQSINIAFSNLVGGTITKTTLLCGVSIVDSLLVGGVIVLATLVLLLTA